MAQEATAAEVTTKLLIAGIMAIVLGIVVMLLWNWCLVPAIPVLSEIGALQGIGIYILSNIFFKSVNSYK